VGGGGKGGGGLRGGGGGGGGGGGSGGGDGDCDEGGGDGEGDGGAGEEGRTSLEAGGILMWVIGTGTLAGRAWGLARGRGCGERWGRGCGCACGTGANTVRAAHQRERAARTTYRRSARDDACSCVASACSISSTLHQLTTA